MKLPSQALSALLLLAALVVAQNEYAKFMLVINLYSRKPSFVDNLAERDNLDFDDSLSARDLDYQELEIRNGHVRIFFILRFASLIILWCRFHMSSALPLATSSNLK